MMRLKRLLSTYTTHTHMVDVHTPHTYTNTHTYGKYAYVTQYTNTPIHTVEVHTPRTYTNSTHTHTTHTVDGTQHD